MKNKMELIEKYIEKENVVLTFGSDDDAFDVEVNDYVDVSTLIAVVDEIVRLIQSNDFDYSLFDVGLAYFIIDLFTDIPIPMREQGDFPDYEKCYDICSRMNLIDEVCAASGNAEDAISYIEKNVWRKLEYYKAMEANRALTMVCGKLYDVLDRVGTIVDQVADVDLQALADELNEVSGKIAAEAGQSN